VGISYYTSKIVRGWKQYGLVAMLRMTKHKMKSRMVLRSNSGDCSIMDLYENLLEKYRAGEICGIAIVPSAFEFDELYNQRTINLAKYLSNNGYGVIYVAWQWHKNEVLQKNYQHVFKNVIQVPLYGFIETHQKFRIFDEISDKKYIIMLPARVFYDLLFFMKDSGFDIYYDIMDDWQQFHEVGQAPWYIENIEEAVILNSNKVTAVSEPLVRKFSYLRQDIELVGNGFYPDVLGEMENIACNAYAGESGSNESFNIGYFGHLTDSWFDWDLMFDILEKHENLNFHVIGYGESEKIRNKIKRMPNIKLIGKVSPRELHSYASSWHAAVIPFIKSELAEAVDPIKIYEYLYFGLPTVVTGITHLAGYPFVKVVDNTPEPFYQAVMGLIESRLRKEYDYAAVREFLSDKVWDKRFDDMFKVDFITSIYK